MACGEPVWSYCGSQLMACSECFKYWTELGAMKKERGDALLQVRVYREALQGIADTKESDINLMGGKLAQLHAIMARDVLKQESVTPNDSRKSKDWHCAKCGKRMQFRDGMCWDCYGGDPGQ